MPLTQYQVDAFTSKIFGGNPAAVCPLDEWLPDDLMQKIAMENNLAETAFFVKKEIEGKAVFELRWFTPTIEVDLCGHATLASAHVIFSNGYEKELITFHSPRSGELTVKKTDDFYTMNFPSDEFHFVPTPPEIKAALGITPLECYQGKTDLLVVVADQSIIESLNPDFKILGEIKGRGTIVTALGKDVDFVSRCFFPQAGVDEDPTTGSAHTTMIPYWAQRLGKTELTAMQLSSRVGHLKGNYLGDRVEISGHAVTFMEGKIFV